MVNLKVENLIKRYGNVTVLNDFNIEIKSGEFMVLLGPSGCGKTTVLRCIAGLTLSTSGQIYLEGKKINDLQPKDRDIAMVFQNYALYPHMTVYDNIAFPLKMRKKSKSYINEKVMDIASLLGIDKLLTRKPKELSGGQMQRVALGRALVREPKIFLMDEPLSNLDAKLRTHMRTEIKKLQKKIKITTLYITHDQIEAMSMADRITIMKDGIIQQIGTPIEVYNFPENTFVGQFIGSPPMNLINASVSDNTFYIFSPSVGFPILDSLLQKKLPSSFLIGVRPRDIVIIENDLEREIKFKAIVSYTEMLGDDFIIEAKIGSTSLVVATNNTDLEIEQEREITLGFDYSKIHYFENNTGKRIK